MGLINRQEYLAGASGRHKWWRSMEQMELDLPLTHVKDDCDMPFMVLSYAHIAKTAEVLVANCCGDVDFESVCYVYEDHDADDTEVIEQVDGRDAYCRRCGSETYPETLTIHGWDVYREALLSVYPEATARLYLYLYDACCLLMGDDWWEEHREDGSTDHHIDMAELLKDRDPQQVFGPTVRHIDGTLMFVVRKEFRSLTRVGK